MDRDRLYLGHVLEAIDAAQAFTADGHDAFMADRKTQSAVIRQIEVIGEAVKRLSAATTGAAPQVPWRQIAGARDRLIHGYFQVDLESVWAMVEQDLPVLKQQVRHLLETGIDGA